MTNKEINAEIRNALQPCLTLSEAVADGISDTEFLKEAAELSTKGIDRVLELILKKG